MQPETLRGETPVHCIPCIVFVSLFCRIQLRAGEAPESCSSGQPGLHGTAMERERPEGSGAVPVSEPGPGPGSEVAFVKRRNRGSIRKKPSEEGRDEAPNTAVPVKRPNRGAVASSRKGEGEDKAQPFVFESSNAIQQAGDGGATRALETETAHDRDARCVGGWPQPRATGRGCVLTGPSFE